MKTAYSSPMLSSQLRASIRSNSHLGVTLIELLVSLVLGIFLLGGIVSIYVSSQNNFKSNEELSRMQDSMRFAFEQMGRDVREAGTTPCGTQRITNVLRLDVPTNSVAPYWADWGNGTLVGYESATPIPNGDLPFGTTVNRRVTGTQSDALLIMRTSMNENLIRRITSTSPATSQIGIHTTTTTLRANEVALACDATSGAIFQLATNPATSPPSIDHTASAPTLNCTTRLGYPLTSANCASGETKTFSINTGFVVPYEPAVWYVGHGNIANTRSLYRATIRRVGPSSSTIIMEPREMIPNIEGMNIQYQLFDRQNSVNPIDPLWRDADDPLLLANGWSLLSRYQVVAVRANIIFLSQDTGTGVSADGTQTRAVQRTLTAVFNIRNRDIKVAP
jgi:type IV pilus assembly protein PilW